EPVQQAAELLVAGGDQCLVVAPQEREEVRVQIGLAVAGPVEDLSPEGGNARRQEAIRREERLVRIEALEVQEPVVVRMMVLQEAVRAVEALRQREQAGSLEVVAVDVVRQLPVRVLAEIVLALVEALREPIHLRPQPGAPLVLLLAADELPGRVAPME